MTNKLSRKILGFSDSNSIFSAQWQGPVFFNLIVKMSGISNPRICYVGAAAGDDDKRINGFLKIAESCACLTSVFSLFNMSNDDPDKYFRDVDIIFIDGGVTRNLIALLKEWNVIQAIKRAYADGILLAGASAGISMLFDWCITDSIKTDIRPMPGIGLLKGTVCAHYDVSIDRQRVLAKFLQSEDVSTTPAFALCDGTAALFENEKLSQTFSIKSAASVFEFIRYDKKVHHMPKYIDSLELLRHKHMVE